MNTRKRELLNYIYSKSSTTVCLSAYMYDRMANSYVSFNEARNTLLEFYSSDLSAQEFIVANNIQDTAFLLSDGSQTGLYDVLMAMNQQRYTEDDVLVQTNGGGMPLSKVIPDIGDTATSYVSIMAGFDYMRKVEQDENVSIDDIGKSYPELQNNPLYFNQLVPVLTNPSTTNESKVQTLMTTMDATVTAENQHIFIDFDSSIYSGKSPIAAWISELEIQIDWSDFWQSFNIIWYKEYVIIKAIINVLTSIWNWLGKQIWQNTAFKVDISTKHGHLNIPLRQQIINLDTTIGPMNGISESSIGTFQYLGVPVLESDQPDFDETLGYNYAKLCPENKVLIQEFRFGMLILCRMGTKLNVVFVPYLCEIGKADVAIPDYQFLTHMVSARPEKMSHCGCIQYDSSNNCRLFVYGNQCFDRMVDYIADHSDHHYVLLSDIFSLLYSDTMSYIDFDPSDDVKVTESLMLSCYRFEVLMALLATDDKIVQAAFSTPLWGYDDQLNVEGLEAAYTVNFLENVLGYGFIAYTDTSAPMNPDSSQSYSAMVNANPGLANFYYCACQLTANAWTYYDHACSPIYTCQNINILRNNNSVSSSTIISEFDSRSYDTNTSYSVSVCPYIISGLDYMKARYLFNIPQTYEPNGGNPNELTSIPTTRSNEICAYGIVASLYYSFYNELPSVPDDDKLVVITSSIKPVDYDKAGVVLLTDAYQAAQFKNFLIGAVVVAVAVTAAIVIHKSIVNLQTSIIAQSSKVDALYFKAANFDVGSAEYISTMRQASVEAKKLRGKTALANALGISVPGTAYTKGGFDVYSESSDISEIISLIKG